MQTAQEAKAYLLQIRKTNQNIDTLLATLTRLRRELNGINCEIDPNRVQGSTDGRSLERAVERIDTVERKINAEVDKLVDQKNVAIDLILTIARPEERAVLMKRYVDGLEWPAVADEMGYEERQCYRIHGDALLSFVTSYNNMSVNVSN